MKMPPSPRPSPASWALTSGRDCLPSQGTAAGSRKSFGALTTSYALRFGNGNRRDSGGKLGRGTREKTPLFRGDGSPATRRGKRFAVFPAPRWRGRFGRGRAAPGRGRTRICPLPKSRGQLWERGGCERGAGRAEERTKAEARLSRRGGEASGRASEEVGWGAAGESSSGIGAPRQALFSGPRPLSPVGVEGPPRQPLPSPGCGGRRGRPFPGIV